MSRSMLLRVGRALRGLWWLLDQSRRALVNLLLLALVIVLLRALVLAGGPSLASKTTLVVDPVGTLAEQRAEPGLRDTALQQLQGADGTVVRLRDFVAVLDTAARDDKVTQALLLLDDFAGAGVPTLREAAAALARFRAAGKKVYAWGSGFDQRQYFLAAGADEIWLHPMGQVVFEGFGGWRNYYKDALERIGVRANVVRAGKYKNAAEPFSASAPSAATLEADGALYRSLWASWIDAVQKARKLSAGSVMRYIDGLPQALPAAGGRPAQLALQAGLVDGLKTRDEMRALLAERGARDEARKTFRQVSLGEYLERVEPRRGGDAVGIVVAQGTIGDGRAPPGRIGGLSTAELIREARNDERIKALVLRVNSPGGSAFGSELVRRELELTRAAGKPVVVSMGDVAASGGYWIGMAADEIIADEATVTGSIGVIGMLPTAKGTLDKLDVHTGGVTTTWLRGAYDPRRELDPRFEALVASTIDALYQDFVGLVAVQRKRTPQQIDAVAQGRVWSGRDALGHGLVDRLGSFDDAVHSAAQRARMGQPPRLAWVEVEPARWERWRRRLGIDARTALGIEPPLPVAATALGLAPAPLAGELLRDLDWLGEMAERRQPYAAAAHCLCRAP
ncbi:MAG: signal peptide peptidase SppA [Proteobacteria bacterium]|nr:signal peptide peptidase SppA [Pseudomonadota bacterium]